MTKPLTVVVSTISHSRVFLLKKSIYAIFNDQSFIDTLTNGNLRFEQLGPEKKKLDRFDRFSAIFFQALLPLGVNSFLFADDPFSKRYEKGGKTILLVCISIRLNSGIV